MNYPVERHYQVRSNERLYVVWQWLPGEVAQPFGGWTAECKVREDKNNRLSTVLADWDALVTLGEDPDGVPADGYIILEVPQVTIASYDWTAVLQQTGWFDLVLIDTNSKPKNLIAGSVKIFEGMS